MLLEAIRRPIESHMREIDTVIREKLYSDVALVREVSEYIINSGGKRLRPALVVLSAGAFGYGGKRHYELAAIVEFIHTATLLHDDVVDSSELRRGRATANAIFGNAATVLVGDFLYSRAFQMMVELEDLRVMEILAATTNTIAAGEVLQLLHCHNTDIDEARYLAVIQFKTAKLFEAAAQLGAIISNASRRDEEAMARYGLHLGTAFQLIDDVLDYSEDPQSIGKNLGDDLAEGKPTLPLIYLLEHGTHAQQALVRNAIEAGGLAELDGILAALRESGALAHAQSRAEAEGARARAAVAHLADSTYKDSLLQLTDFAVTRKF